MNKTFGKRYVPSSQILTFDKGTLYYGTDLYLNRAVMLYTTECPAGQSGEDYVHKFSHTGSFHHILDASFEGRSVLIVLKLNPGKLFLEEFKKKIWTFSDVITLVADLGVSMLDAMEQQITGYSIGAENLWISEEGRISIINYWDEGEPQKQGAIGLCSLLIQIFSGATEIPGPFEALHTHLERIHIPYATAEQKAALVKLIKLVGQGQTSLSTFIFGLRSLSLENNPAANKKLLSSPAQNDPTFGTLNAKQRATAKDNESTSAVDPNIEEEPTRLYKWIGAGIFTLVFTVFLVWLLSSSPFQKRDIPITPSDSIKPAQDSGPTKTPEPKKVQPTVTPGIQETAPEQNKEVSIPNLVGLTQADAEKQALASGLHYNYILEANEQIKGSVLKQDPEAGTKASQGGNVTFWVGK